MAGAISTILATVQNNFGVLFQPTLAVPQVLWYFGPEWIGQQSGPAQIIAFPGRETPLGPEPHYNPPGQPRSLRQVSTRIVWMIWAPWAPLPNWAVSQVVATGALTGPTLLNANGYYFTATIGGIAGTMEPPWPSTIGHTVVDGTITWTCTGTTVSYSVTKTDNVEAIRAALIQAIHAALVGSYKITSAEWYTKSDQMAMAGVYYAITTETKVPLVDYVEGTAKITSIPITGVVEAA